MSGLAENINDGKKIDDEDTINNEIVDDEKAMDNNVINNIEKKNEESDSSNSEDELKLPFPRATITNLIRKNVSKGKQIKGTVKNEMNVWVSDLIERIASKMNSQPYTYVNYDMLKESISPYEEMSDINSQRKKLIEKINSLSTGCDSIIDEIDSGNSKTELNLEEELPFPKATITNKLRSSLDEGKTIKGPVKKGMNIWLGKIVSRVSKKMDSYPYPYIDRSMFKESIEPYEAVKEVELEKERIIQQMESIKTACDILISEVERKFKN